jgi:transglutaminase-like putative cysteine protease
MFDAYLAETEIVNWSHENVRALAAELNGDDGDGAVAARCFFWVRDRIRHSIDHGDQVLTFSASEVLRHRTGFCYAKSHLLVALLRANGIPAGFGYQRLSLDDQGPPYCLHGYSVVRLRKFGWYRIDPRGERPGISTDFDPPREQLAFQAQLAGEQTFEDILAEPLPIVVDALRGARSVTELMGKLPDRCE